MKTTDAEYNAQSRHLDSRLLLYFNAIPLEVTKDNYLLTYDILDDVGFANDSPVQSLAANELSCVLLNANKMFSPTNASGPYYGKIKQGVKIEVQIRPSVGDFDWDNLGTYYVTDWNVSYDGMRITVSALDNSQKLITDTSYPNLPVIADNTAAYLANIFGDIPYNIIEGIPNTSHLFPKNTRKDTLNGILNAKSRVSTCDRNGVIQVGKLPFSNVEKVITDNDQIIDLEAINAFITQYEDATVSYSIPEVKIAQQILSLENVPLLAGTNEYVNANFTSKYVKSIDYAKVESSGATTFKLNSASANQASFSVEATQADAAASVNIFGSYLNLPTFNMLGTGRCVKVTNEYVQSAAEAQSYRDLLKTFVVCPNQTIKVKIRGNPHIALGSLIRVVSAKYSMTFVGIVVESNLTYDGGLSGTITLLNKNAIGG